MTSVLSWKNSVSLCLASFCISRPTLPVIPGISRLHTFFIPLTYDEKDIFWVFSSRRSCRSSQNCSISASSALLVGAQNWITVILNGLPWKQREIILLLFFFFCLQIKHFIYWPHRPKTNKTKKKPNLTVRKRFVTKTLIVIYLRL